MRHILWKQTAVAMAAGIALAASAQAWWDKAWTARSPVTIDMGSDGVEIAEPIGDAVVLLRLHEGNFNFAAAAEDGSDLRILAEDDQTLLPHHIERYDALMNEAFVWVKVPAPKEGAQTKFWVYYGNLAGAENAQDPAATFDDATALAYHFATVPASDSSAGKNNAEGGGSAVQGAMIGGGLRLDGQSAVKIPGSPTLAWNDGAASWSAWVKPVVDQPEAVIFSRSEGGNAFVVGIENGVPYLQIRGGGATAKTPAGEPIPAGTWRHVAVSAADGKAELFVNGESQGAIDAALPALAGDAFIGGNAEAGEALFIGELDEMRVRTAALPAGAVKFDAVSQGGSADAGKLVQFGELEQSGGHGGHSEALEHVMLFGDIAKNMMFDGWIAVGVCILMIIFGWWVAVKKFNYLNSIQKGSEIFMKKWQQVSSDLTALDGKDGRGLLGDLDAKTAKLMRKSPIFHLYHIGSEEIQHRVGNGKKHRGLSARSIQAIRASLDTGLVRENQRMNKGLIFLTISIAGGPYVGLLGTVVGVMITFAIIAKSGEVDVNSIAPGIASALLATVAGLVVAIPALFIYSYLSSRIKDLVASMQVFIDEFIAKMAEFYPTPGESGLPIPPPPSQPELASAHAEVASASDR